MKKPLLTLGTVAILFAVPFILAAQKPEEIEKANKLAIAIMPDTPPMDISGTVLMPDGSPADWCLVDVQSVAYKFSRTHDRDGNTTVSKENCYLTSCGMVEGLKMKRLGDDGTFKLAGDGTFKLAGSVYPGGNTVVAVYPTSTDEKIAINPNKHLVAKPVVFVPREDMQPLKIQLEEGIPLRGKVLYENGKPAAERHFNLEQEIEPPLGADIKEMKERFRTSRSVHFNDNGEYEVFLLPGDYTILTDSNTRKEPLTIAKTDKEKHLDLTMPTPIFVEVENEDGSAPEEVTYSFVSKGSISGPSKKGGSFVLPPYHVSDTENGFLYLISKDRKGGTLETTTPDMLGKTVRFKLKPACPVTVSLIGADGRPAAGERVYLRLSVERQSGMTHVSQSLLVDMATTNAEGEALLYLAPGENMTVVLQLPAGGPQDEVKQTINLAPGTKFDFGRYRVGRR
jgi:hypothetical protein